MSIEYFYLIGWPATQKDLTQDSSGFGRGQYFVILLLKLCDRVDSVADSPCKWCSGWHRNIQYSLPVQNLNLLDTSFRMVSYECHNHAGFRRQLTNIFKVAIVPDNIRITVHRALRNGELNYRKARGMMKSLPPLSKSHRKLHILDKTSSLQAPLKVV